MKRNWIPGSFYGVVDFPVFDEGLNRMFMGMKEDGVFIGDNLITFSKGLGFLDDEPLMEAMVRNAANADERSLLWRINTVLWGVRNGLRLEGDFVECACYKGTTARVVCEAVDFAGQTDRHYYLYDLFDHDPSMPHHAMTEHSKQLYAQVKQRFADCPNVTVTQGRVPDVLQQVAPQKIAFMHLDLNNREAELGALELLFERMVPGAVLVLDDYGWLGYADQRIAENAWFGARGYRVLELPTGQGLVIKH